MLILFLFILLLVILLYINLMIYAYIEDKFETAKYRFIVRIRFYKFLK
jgi:hypothetical protein